MPFIYKDADIRDRRVKLFIDNLHQAFTRLMLIDKEAADLIDAEQEKAEIALLSAVDGETFPVLPFGDELVFQFNSIGLEIEENNSIILVYDTEDIDDELFNRVFPVADTITDPTNREAVKERYRLLRDEIKFWAMGDIAIRLDEEIDRLLFCINASKKYSVQKNIETKQLELIYDDNGKQRRVHKDEEVFYPFHNKPTINEFIDGLRGKY
jgi:hypothetical protein